MAHHELVLAWLNDAHAMELSIARVLENHAKDATDHPALQARLQEHLEQTRGHAAAVKGCVKRLGGDTSALKTGIATAMGTVQGMATELAKDEPVKNALHDYGTEHFEIACYASLVAAADELGDAETARVCREILRDEEAMAAFLLAQVPPVTLAMVRQQAATHGQ